MMSKYSLWFVVAVVVLQAGCSIGKPSRPADFYVLSTEPAQPVSGRQDPAGPLLLGLGPLSLSDVFDRPQIVTRPDPNQVQLAEFDRWAGDLKKNLEQVLAENLMSRLNTDSVVAFPWSSRSEPDFQIAVHFFRLDGDVGQLARIEGVWRLLDGEKGCELAARRFKFEQQPAGSGYAEFVSAMSHALARLSQEIAEQVAAAEPGCRSGD
jgi:uncharacterized lipoprotein YmbA